jgi:hypothetical protein
VDDGFNRAGDCGAVVFVGSVGQENGMTWSIFKYDYSKGSTLTNRAALDVSISSVCPSSKIDDEFNRFLFLAEDQLRALVYKYHDTNLAYGSNAKDFPLCLDFAELCSSDVRRGAMIERMVERPAFGVLRYTKKSGDRHAINFAVLSDGSLKYFEPQPVDDPWMNAPKDVGTLDEFSI